ncbi:MAG: PLP-dependent aminotransferase family protein [Terriglobia bacterium]|jgi:GntR family transcriptional regulator/MocR family aminotransferase
MRKAAAGLSPLIAIDRETRAPLHAQIYEAFRAAILARNLRAGERIISTRALALELRISRIPALNAYAQLLAEGYFESRVGAGTLVCSSLPAPPAPPEDPSAGSDRARRMPAPIALRSSLLPRYERPPWMRGRGAFNVSQPAMEAFPSPVLSKLVARYCRNLRPSGLHYGDPMGLIELREAIGRYLRAARAVRCDTAQIMITSGSQQALDIATRVLLEVGSPVWVEEPGYWLSRQILAAGCQLVPVPVDHEGLNVAEGTGGCRKARAAYVAPSHQYPLGATMSAAPAIAGLGAKFALLDCRRRLRQ